jgi:alpha-beta hydrolase superfamily lysophospholipase
VGTLRHILKAVVYGAIGAFFMLLAGAVYYLDSRPDLRLWHQVELDEEYTKESSAQDIAAYLTLEDRLFNQLDALVYDRLRPEDRGSINRYHRGSLSDPGRWPVNWNRSFEFSAESANAGILLLHGMSDSPYSLRNLGQRLHEAGAWVVGLRLPGHGTAPAGLTTVHWQDMAAAVRLAMRHLRDKVGDKPVYIVGYSNGGALAVHYALTALEDATLPATAGLVLISPAIGVTPLAAFAVWQARLGHLLGLPKLEWNVIQPEYDPFKYSSFAVNAGDQTYRLTLEIRSRLQTLHGSGELGRFPPVLAFQSAVDATVSAPVLVKELFEGLPAGGHELVLFDINRFTSIEQILQKDPRQEFEALFAAPTRPFTLSIITNLSEQSQSVLVRRKPSGNNAVDEDRLGLDWPQGLYSLSHIAVPFPMDDPLYGAAGSGRSPGLELGSLALRGERGVLLIAASDMLRLRWNPFYSYLERRVLEFIRPSQAVK